VETASVATSQITFQDVLQLVELIKGSAGFSELRIRSGDIEIDLRRGASTAPIVADAQAPALSARAVPPTGTSAPPVEVGAAAPVSTAKARPSTRAASRQGASVVKAPMVGTIYRAPEPGARPFVEVGQEVAAGAQLCIIEVMKLMNAVVAERAGIVTEILVRDGEAVEFGQDLFVVSPR
jgi:acetyl-CoA carboxylase biotin carboxyl carrier protein